MTGTTRYKAFLSYSHRDRSSAKWLHNALETYKVPRHLAGRETLTGQVPGRLTPIFVDRDELPATDDLTKTVREALEASEFLIVICSPHAAHSPWVNKEILDFKARWGEDKIRCLIVSGEPFSSDIPGREHEECFPKALRYHIGADGTLTGDRAEPVAADLRPQGDGKKFARLKLIAGLIGIGLDELVHRDAHRTHVRFFWLTGMSFTSLVVLSVLTLTAIDARRSTQEKKLQAEDLVEFMLGDLRDKLGPSERLAILDAVGQEAFDYYARSKPSDLDDASLARRARALLLLGQIQALKGDLDRANGVFAESWTTTAELLERQPDNEQRIYEHAQATFWVSSIQWRRRQLSEAEIGFAKYMDLARKLTEIDPYNIKWQLELAYAHNNLGSLNKEQGKMAAAIASFTRARDLFTALTQVRPDETRWQLDLGQAHSWLSSTLMETGNLAEALTNREAELAIYKGILERNSESRAARQLLVSAQRHHARYTFLTNSPLRALEELALPAEMSTRLMLDEPENTLSAEITASINLDQAEIILAAGLSRDARAALERATAITTDLLGKAPDNPEWQEQLRCRSLVLYGRLGLKTGDLEGGLVAIATAIRELEDHRTLRPDNLSLALSLASATLTRGELHLASNDVAMARQSFTKARTILEQPGLVLPMASRDELARAVFFLGDEQEARDIAAPLVSSGYRHPEFSALFN